MGDTYSCMDLKQERENKTREENKRRSGKLPETKL